MGFKTGHEKMGGRQKGTPNKLTRNVKDILQQVFNELQADPEASLLTWAKNNPAEFYKMAARLIPADVNAAIGDVTIQFKDAE